MKLRLVVFLVACLVCVSCGWFGGKPKEAATALDEKSSLQVLKEAGKDSYQQPKDGRLTEQQVQMYLKVQNRALELMKVASMRLEEQSQKAEAAEKNGSSASLREGMKALSKVGDVLTVDLRAAQELGVNTAEYKWVKGEILKAYAASWYQGASESFNTQSLQSLEQARTQAKTVEEQKFFDEQIAQVKKTMAEEQASKAAKEQTAGPRTVQSNVELVGKYRQQLDQLKILAGKGTARE